MTFRDKVRKAFGRSSSPKDNGKPKIEYYRRSEVPRSKYRGPVDPEHRRKLYAWNFADATADRRRSFDLDLSPCTSLPDVPGDDRDMDEEVMDSEPEVDQRQQLLVLGGGSITIAHHEVVLSRSVDTGSQSSTAVDSDSYGSSILTLKESWDWPLAKRDAFTTLKEAMCYTSPITRRISAPEKRLPFRPDDLTQVLNAVRIVS